MGLWKVALRLYKMKNDIVAAYMPLAKAKPTKEKFSFTPGISNIVVVVANSAKRGNGFLFSIFGPTTSMGWVGWWVGGGGGWVEGVGAGGGGLALTSIPKHKQKNFNNQPVTRTRYQIYIANFGSSVVILYLRHKSRACFFVRYPKYVVEPWTVH